MYDTNPWLYDVECSGSGIDADLPFWRKLVDEYRPQRVLELACGTGRVTIPVAEHGARVIPDFRIVGLDISQPCLDRAEARRARMDPRVAETITFVHGDMVKFDLGKQFDVIFISINSIMYIKEIADQQSLLASVRNHLALDGRFVIDIAVIPHFILGQAQNRPARLALDLNFTAPDYGVKRFLRSSAGWYDAATQSYNITNYYEVFHDDGRHERHVEDESVHVFFPRELELLMLRADLKVVTRMGSYDRAADSRPGHRYLWIMAPERSNAAG